MYDPVYLIPSQFVSTSDLSCIAPELIGIELEAFVL